MLEFSDGPKLRDYLIALRNRRRNLNATMRRPRIARLTKTQREEVLVKTGGKCHICGGAIEESWQADHVIAHSAGGGNRSENFLPAHALCNNYRWDYLPQEFELILKLGVWARSQIERATVVGKAISTAFAAYELRRAGRRSTGRRASRGRAAEHYDRIAE